MISWRFLSFVAIVGAVGATGWVLNKEPSAEAEKVGGPAVLSDAASLSASNAQFAQELGQPLRPVTLHNDGTVTINVSKVPVDWVLEALSRQGGGPAVASVREAHSNSAAAESERNQIAFDEAKQYEQTMRAIDGGDEKTRYEALAAASSYGFVVPQEKLKTLFETDPSERVRLHAFQSYMAHLSDNREESRGALQAALYSPSSAIQAEAKKRLEWLSNEELRRSSDTAAATDAQSQGG